MTGAGSAIQKAVAILCVLLLPLSAGYGQAPASYGQPPAGYSQPPAYGQAPSGYGQAPAGSPQGWPAAQPAPPLLPPEQLDNLVAPVALYPDPLLGQVLAASTYPLEITEAQQWLQRNRNLQGTQLLDAAKQQNWDPSVQALVAFPDALNLLGNDIRWTTDLGNAFLAQQADVMNAVQAMRARAQANGRLQSTPQQVVTMDTQGGQNAIEIQPANPQVIYVPVYQPEYVYGPPAWGAYPDLWYPPGFGFGFGFGAGLFIGGLFPGWLGWGGWGWGCGWFGHGLFVNAGFFNRYGFHGGFGGRFGDGRFGGGFGGRTAWAHDPGHRMGVPYPNRAVASRFNSDRFNGSGRFNSGRGFSTGARSSFGGFAGNRASTNGYAGSYRSAAPNYGARSASLGYRSTAPGYGGYNSASSYRGSTSYNRSFAPAYSRSGQNYSAPRSYSVPRQNFSAPRQNFSAPRQNFSASRSFSAPRSYSAPRASGGGSHFSGGYSGGGGGHASSGGGHPSGGGGHHR
jgi:hypothetical protein